MKTKLSYQERVDKAVAEGKLWRAKEILQGRIGSLPYDQDCYELYGRVLLKMGDTVNAGRLFFASGRVSTEYQVAIELFLERNKLANWKDLIFLLPRSSRNIRFENLPENIQSELLKRGFEQVEYNQLMENLRYVHEAGTERLRSRWDGIKEQLFKILVFAVLGWTFFALIGGSILMIKYVLNFVMRKFG